MRIIFIALTLLCIPVSSLAGETKSIDCGSYEGQKIKKTNAYLGVYNKAKAVCLGMGKVLLAEPPLTDKLIKETLLAQNLKDFGASAAQALLDDFGNSATIKLTVNVEEMKAQLADTNIATGKIPEFVTDFASRNNLKGFFPSGSATKFSIPKDHEDCRQVDQSKNCYEIFADFEAAFNVYRKPYEQFTTGNNAKLLRAINKEWDRFLKLSKSQTALEVWLTSQVNYKHLKQDHIVGPPKTQVIALHPQLVYEYVEDVPAGDNAEFGMAVEWLGVNWWDLKVPLGISAASVYSDHENTKDVRHGVMIHIDNKYAFGWGKKDDVESFYFTMDLLKLFENKKQQYQGYLN